MKYPVARGCLGQSTMEEIFFIESDVHFLLLCSFYFTAHLVFLLEKLCNFIIAS